MRTLDGVRVLEIGHYIAAPYCGPHLAAQGAEVTKLEGPGVGEPRRTSEPLVERDGRVVSGGTSDVLRGLVDANEADLAGWRAGVIQDADSPG